MTKKLLILKGSEDVCKEEVFHIANSAKLFGIEPYYQEIRSLEDVKNLKDLGVRFDYIHLCAHANPECFGDNKTYEVKWIDFGSTICFREILNEGAVFLLACCRSGLNKVAYDLFFSCSMIEYVCGPRWTLTALDLSVAFNVFLYNMEIRKLQPNQAAEKMSHAVGYDFYCYDRIEVERMADYLKHAEFLETHPVLFAASQKILNETQKYADIEDAATIDHDRIQVVV